MAFDIKVFLGRYFPYKKKFHDYYTNITVTKNNNYVAICNIMRYNIVHLGDHQITIPYKVWGTVRVTDSYKVPTFHIRYWGP